MTPPDNKLDYDLIVESLKGHLPSLPVVMNELMMVISDHDAALYALRDLLKMDQTIYAQLLKIANTHRYREGREGKVVSIDDAVQVLGLEKVKQVAMNTTILDLYGKISFPKGFSLEALWMHSVGVAIASSILAGKVDSDLSDQAYTCGLLHDIGKVAKCKFDQILYSEEMKSVQDRKVDVLQWEISSKSIRHDLLGSYLARAWGISTLVETVTRWHHEEDRSKRIGIEDAKTQLLVDIVFLANVTIHKLGFGHSGHRIVRPPSRLIMRRLGLDENALDEFDEKVSERLEEEAENLALFTKA
ncbi:MAG TPA: hypothetical protein DCG39_08000 [Opitutae bacterium]|nr:hypothetical protein [Opitutae bacterium]|tara:strand:- start:2552 stop:3457 length:906 start_codon:yes stop_codon:yes gene_type:complete